MILGKGLRSENFCQKKNFRLDWTITFFGKGESFEANELHFRNSFGYFSGPVKIG